MTFPCTRVLLSVYHYQTKKWKIGPSLKFSIPGLFLKFNLCESRTYQITNSQIKARNPSHCLSWFFWGGGLQCRPLCTNLFYFFKGYSCLYFIINITFQHQHYDILSANFSHVKNTHRVIRHVCDLRNIKTNFFYYKKIQPYYIIKQV